MRRKNILLKIFHKNTYILKKKLKNKYFMKINLYIQIIANKKLVVKLFMEFDVCPNKLQHS